MVIVFIVDFLVLNEAILGGRRIICPQKGIPAQGPRLEEEEEGHKLCEVTVFAVSKTSREGKIRPHAPLSGPSETSQAGH